MLIICAADRFPSGGGLASSRSRTLPRSHPSLCLSPSHTPPSSPIPPLCLSLPLSHVPHPFPSLSYIRTSPLPYLSHHPL
ncbi:hypothetical protein FKM82_011280 [Ascaphus truei]